MTPARSPRSALTVSGAASRPANVPLFLPRTYQIAGVANIVLELRRHIFFEWPRRHGKDRTFINASCQVAQEKPINVFHCLPKYAQARKAIWEQIDARTGRRLLDDVLPYAAGVRNDEMTITFPNGSVYRLIGSDNYHEIVGAGPYIIGYSEWARCDPAARGYFKPMLDENQGIEVFMTTMFGENHGAALADFAAAHPEDWYYSRLTIDQTVRDAPGEDGGPVVSQADIERELEIWRETSGRAGMSPEMIEQEFYNSRLGVNTGNVYGKELRDLRERGHVGDVPHDPALLVHTAWDRGVHNRIWFYQKKGRNRYVIDYLATDNDAPAGIVRKMREDHRAQYNYGEHWVSRDALDPQVGVGTNWVKQFGDLGMRLRPLLRNFKKQSQIDALKAVLSRCWFDKTRCDPGLLDVASYHYEWDDKKKQYGKDPVHDGASHAADALAVMALADQDDKEARNPDGASPVLPRGPNAWMAR